MNRNEIFEDLKSIILNIKEEELELSENTALIESNILDSLELINYLTQIDEKFGINISFDELVEHKLGLIKNMIDYIISKNQ